MLIGHSNQKKTNHKEAGEGYLASAADLMIGILFIFIIVVVYLALETKQSNTPDPVQRIDPTPVVKITPVTSPPPKTNQPQGLDLAVKDPVGTIINILGKRLTQQGVEVILDPDSGVIAISADALFDKGKHIPRPAAIASIEKTKKVLADVLPCYSNSPKREAQDCKKLNDHGLELETVMVEGHTDSDQYPNEPDKNWYLGLDRARYIFNELGKTEIGRLKNKKGQPLLGVSSYADSRPSKSFSKEKSEDPKAKDRRVELRFILSYQNETSANSSSTVIRSIQER